MIWPKHSLSQENHTLTSSVDVSAKITNLPIPSNRKKIILGKSYYKSAATKMLNSLMPTFGR